MIMLYRVVKKAIIIIYLDIRKSTEHFQAAAFKSAEDHQRGHVQQTKSGISREPRGRRGLVDICLRSENRLGQKEDTRQAVR